MKRSLSIVGGPKAGVAFTIATNKLIAAIARCSEATITCWKGKIDTNDPSTTVTINRTDDEELIDQLLADLTISKGQRKKLAELQLAGEDIANRPVTSVQNAASSLALLSQPDEPNFEIRFGTRWYPVQMTVELQKGQDDRQYCVITGILSFAGHTVNMGGIIGVDDFASPSGANRPRLINDIIARFDLRLMSGDIDVQRKKLVRVKELNMGRPIPMKCIGRAISMIKDFWNQDHPVSINFGAREAPQLGMVDGKLEQSARYGDRVHTMMCEMPFVRFFSITMKRWLFIDPDDLVEHTFNPNASEMIVLDSETELVLKPLFGTRVEALFGDLIGDQHGGMIIAAVGPTGVGKTLAARVFSEMSERVLYPVELAELGLDPKDIEKNLETVFRRAEAWNAVLLIDEADVLLSKRGADLQKSAIVAVFLRLLDYYRGFLFLTSNRPDDMDDAFRSRITLTVPFKALDDRKRAAIWTNMLTAANMTIITPEGDVFETREIAGRALAEPTRWREIAKRLNGRQIRNIVRIAKAMHGTNVALNDMFTLFRTASMDAE